MSLRSLSYCAEQVRLHDRDRYLTALFAPDSRREALLALGAFNLEISRIRETVSERLIGEMRLQWWRDALENLYAGGRPPAHPVAESLARAMGAHRLARHDFARLLDARARDLDDAPFSDLSALRVYAADTSAPLTRLALQILDVSDPGAAEAAEDVGTAYALAGLLRAVPFHARQKRLYLPQTVCDEVGLDVGELFDLKPGASLPGVIKVVASEAHACLGRARSRAVPRAALPALLPAVVAEVALDRLERVGFDPFALRTAHSSAWLPLTLAWHAWRDRF